MRCEAEEEADDQSVPEGTLRERTPTTTKQIAI